MRKYASSRVKRRIFYRKSELQMFLMISGGHVGGQFLSTNMASPYKALHTYIHTYFIGSSPRGFSESILHYKIMNQVHDNKNITMIKEDKGQ